MEETASDPHRPNLPIVVIVSYLENPKPFLSTASTLHNAGKSDSLRLEWAWQQSVWLSRFDYPTRIISANVLESLIRRVELYLTLQYEAQCAQGEPRMISLHILR